MTMATKRVAIIHQKRSRQVTQEKIKDLLAEAANPKCAPHRRNEIQCELGHATAAMRPNGVYDIDSREAGILVVIEHLYVDTLQNRPEILPALFPVFALACGDRDNGLIVTDIDWKHV